MKSNEVKDYIALAHAFIYAKTAFQTTLGYFDEVTLQEIETKFRVSSIPYLSSVCAVF